MKPPVIEGIDGRLIVRDDLLDGGTKSRAVASLLGDHHEEYCYAGPVFGYAQVALAYAARDAGKRATLFCAKRKEPHARTFEAHRAGAKVVQVPTGYLSNVRSKARAYCAEVGALLLPFGLDCPEAIAAVANAARSLKLSPTQVWVASGSGVLTRALQLAWPEAEHHAVLVGSEDAKTAMAIVHRAPERFEQNAQLPPPFPSCSNYDAKVWRFFREAAPGALMWNVAR